MTANEIIKNSSFWEDDHDEIREMMIMFAKYHVKEALQKASVANLSIDIDEYIFDKMGEIFLTEEAVKYNVKSILNAYPLNLIK